MINKTALCVVIGLLSLNAISQQDSLLPGNIPPKLKISEIGADYKAFRLKGPGDSGGMFGGVGGLAMMGMMGGGMGNPKDNPFSLFSLLDVNWTKEEIVKIGNSDFIVTYKPELGFPKGTGTPTAPTIAMRLVLIRTDTITSIEPLTDITTSDLEAALSSFGIKENGETVTLNPGSDATAAAMMVPVAAQAHVAAQATANLSNVKQLSLGMLLYQSDWDDKFPYVQDTESLRPILDPYLKNNNLWQVIGNPGSRFLFNMSLSGSTVTELEEPANTPMFYESQPDSSGKRAVGFADGHAKRVEETEWQGMQRYLHLNLKKFGKPLPVKHESGSGT
jgi:hypothetical protein